MRKRRGRPPGRMSQFMPIGALDREALEMLDSRAGMAPGSDLVRDLGLTATSRMYADRRALF